MEVEFGGETAWREFEILRAFDTQEEARSFAAKNNVPFLSRHD